MGKFYNSKRQVVKLYKGDHKPLSIYKGREKYGGYHEESKSGESVSFSSTYNDVAEVLVHGNTVQKSDYYIKEGLSSQYQDTKTMGKNLFDGVFKIGVWKGNPSEDTGSVLSYTSTNVTNICSANKIRILPNTTYHIKNYNGVGDFRYWIIDKNDVIISTLNFYSTGGVITTGATVEQYIVFRIAIGSNDTSVGKVQLELGSTATAFEPYKDIVKDGLVMELSGRNFFNNPPTTVLQDRSGNGNVGTPSGFAYTNTSGSDGNGGIVFDAVDDKIAFNSLPDTYLNSGGENQPITLEVWCRNNSKAQGIILGKVGYNTGLVVYDGSIKATLWDSTLSNKSISYYVPNGTLVHIVATFYNGVFKLYANGSLVGTNNQLEGHEYKNLAGKLTIGGSTWACSSTVYSARVYNRVLSDAEVYQNYFAGINLNVPSPTDPSPVVSNLPKGTYKYTSTDGIYEFTLDDDLRGIDSSLDKIVFDRVSHKGYVERKCAKTILNGTEVYGRYTSSNEDRFTQYTIGAYGAIRESRPLATHLKGIKESERGKPNVIYFSGERGENVTLSFELNRFVDVNAMKSWLTSNNITVTYAKITPTKTPLTFTKVSSSTKTEVPMTFLTTTPSLDYPAEVWDVSGNVKSRSKNLYTNLYSYTGITYGITVTANADGSNSFSGTATKSGNYRLIDPNKGLYMLKAGTYTASITNISPELIAICDVSNSSSWSVLTNIGAGKKNVTFTLTKDTPIGVYQTYTNGKTYNETVYFQIEVGSVATEYEPYKASTQLALPALRKIGAIEDTFNPKTGEHIKRISNWVTLDGSLFTGGWVNGAIGLSGTRNVRPRQSIFDSTGLLMGYKYDSTLLGDGIHSDNQIGMYQPEKTFYIGVNNEMTGWNSSMRSIDGNISNGELKAYFYGWKMCNADGTSPYYKSEVPYNPSTWAEWGKTNTTISSNTAEITASSGNVGVQMNTNLKPSTKYGILLNIPKNNLGGKFRLSLSSTRAIEWSPVASGVTGNIKSIATSNSSITNNSLFLYIESGDPKNVVGQTIQIKDIRIFELPAGSQIESDFNTLTADQLCNKYTFNGLCEKNWVHVTDGQGKTNVLPTASYEGYTPYKMIYELATPVISQLAPQPIPTYYPNTVIETDCVNAVPIIDATVKVED